MIPKTNKNYIKRWLIIAGVLISIIFLIILPLLFNKTKAKQTSTDTRIKKVLFIIVDGIPADLIEKANVPNIRHIEQLGKYKRAHVGGDIGTYTETVTVSVPGYMSLLTGTWKNKHNASDNAAKHINYNYKNIFRLVKEQQPDRKTAIFSTWTRNRVEFVGEGLSQAGNITFDYKFDGYELDQVNYPHDPASLHIHHIDQRVVSEASHCIKNDAPDISWVYLQYTDDIGHSYGDSPQMDEAIGYVDQQIGQIYESIQYRIQNHHEDWLIVITTDHGRESVTGRHHHKQSERERTTWIVMNYPDTNTYFRDYQPSIVDIMPTMMRFMNMKIPTESERELDGVPFIGAVSLANTYVTLHGYNLTIKWKALDNRENVGIWLSTTNLYQNGSTDDYIMLGSVPVKNEIAIYNIVEYPSKYYKIVLEGKYNTVNKWIIR